MKRDLTLVAVSLCFTIAVGGCSRNGHDLSPKKLSDYEDVDLSYQELAYCIEVANKQSTNPIETFSELTNCIKHAFQDVSVTAKESNPFPTCLADRSYKWLNSWSKFSNSNNIPLIWTTVQLFEPKILFITTQGKVGLQDTNGFDRLINIFAGTGGTNITQE